MRRFFLLLALVLVAGVVAYRPLLRRIVDLFTIQLIDLVEEGRFEEAVELEQALLNSVQRLLGAPPSDYAARKWRGE